MPTLVWFAGMVGIIDPPRGEAAVAIREAHRAGIRVVMITGDHPRTAARIAADLGIAEPGVPALSGVELDALDAAAFAEAVRTTSVYARVSPARKLRIVDALQANGHIVATTGDGVNDAPALKSADIGIAMGAESLRSMCISLLSDSPFTATDRIVSMVSSVYTRGNDRRMTTRFNCVRRQALACTLWVLAGSAIDGRYAVLAASARPSVRTRRESSNSFRSPGARSLAGSDTKTPSRITRRHHGHLLERCERTLRPELLNESEDRLKCQRMPLLAHRASLRMPISFMTA